MKVVATVIIGFLALAKAELNSCPPSEDIKPCVCKIGADKKPWISCENLNSVDALVKAVKSMGSFSISSFTLWKSNIGVLPSHTFDGLEIDSLYILDCNLTRLSEDRNTPPFLGLENSLDYLEVRNSFNKIVPLASLSLSHLKKLTFIQLDGNAISSVGNNWFESGPYGLQELRIVNSNLSTLGSHAFEALEHLDGIIITSGLLTKITRSMFPMPAQYLRTLDLSENKLEALPEDIFTKMPALNEVYLENNALTTINEMVFYPVWSQLEYVYMYGNPIRCDSNIRWIYKYRLPGQFDGYCRFPEKLLNKRLRNITLSDLE